MPSYQTWIKVAILLEALEVPYDLVVLAGAKDMYTEWYREIHPQQYVPALVDSIDGERFVLWDSTAIILYITDRYDKEGKWTDHGCGSSRAAVGNWSFFHACSFFPIAKLWLQLNMRPVGSRNLEMEEHLHHEMKVRFSLLNDRLSQPGQDFVALKDRPTVADIINYPFTDDETSNRLNLPLRDWPALQRWSARMRQLEPVRRMYDRLETLGPTKQS
ncbi:hypothetical protein EG328_002563 [Venturia inaequalis]|uniref:glutathione transferase n=2 Tax=Venturia inaequalis TaxID=5025 RepID=A0A8H3YIH8_VENIN|nr:hypothetical protein EG328_002563 [Venturia inaequalis]KAE9972405.1 hypothetical protein EG327_009506 [Venturia inaequalis]RDI82399.1 hypothetical protein Vi05172_g7749 [Venturia inaequalis]